MLRLSRELEDAWGIATSLEFLGDIDRCLGDYEAASARSQENLSICRELGNMWAVAKNLRTLGISALNWGDYDQARALLQESPALLRESLLTADAVGYAPDAGNTYAVALALAGLSEIAKARRQGVRAAQLLRGAEAMVLSIANVRDLNDTGSVADRIEYKRLAFAGSGQLQDSSLAAAWPDGQPMTWERAIELALQFEAEA